MAFSPSKQWAQPASPDEYATEASLYTQRELQTLQSTPEFIQWQQKERQRNMINRAKGNVGFTVICVIGALSVRTFLQGSDVAWMRELWPAIMFLSIVGVTHTLLDLFDVYVLRPIQMAVSSEVRDAKTIYLLWAVLAMSFVSLTFSNLFLNTPTTSYLESWTSGIDVVLDFTRSTLATPLRLLGWSAVIDDLQALMASHEQLRLTVAIILSTLALIALFLGVRLWSKITFAFGFTFIFVTFLSVSGLGLSIGTALANAAPSAVTTLLLVPLSLYALKATYGAFGSFGWTVVDPHSGEMMFNFTPYLRGAVTSTVTLSAAVAFWASKLVWVGPVPIWLKYALQVGLSSIWGRLLGSVINKSARLLMMIVLGIGSAYLAAFASRQSTSFICSSLDDYRPTHALCAQSLPFIQLYTTQAELVQNYGQIALYFPSLSGIVLTPGATFWTILLLLVLSGGAKTLRPIVTFVLGSYGAGWIAGVLSPITEESAFTLRLIAGSTRYDLHSLLSGLVFVLLFSIVTILPLMLEPFFRVALTSSLGLGVLMLEQHVIGNYFPAFNYISWAGIFVLGVFSQLAVLMLEFFGGASDSDEDTDDSDNESDRD